MVCLVKISEEKMRDLVCKGLKMSNKPLRVQLVAYNTAVLSM